MCSIRCQLIFTVFDKDKSGFIDTIEFQRLAAACGLVMRTDAGTFRIPFLTVW
jgi:hypothetical protein